MKFKKDGTPWPTRKGKKEPPEILTEDEFRRLVRCISLKSITGRRNRAMLVLGYRLGLRITEVLSIEPKDVNIDEGWINILHGKGKKQRKVGMDPDTALILQRWIEVRKTFHFPHGTKLFCSIVDSPGKGFKSGRAVLSSYIRNLLPRLRKKAHIEKRVHFHMLRHSFAAQGIKDNINLPAMQQILGHSNLSTTSKYLEHINPQENIDLLKKRTWNSKGL